MDARTFLGLALGLIAGCQASTETGAELVETPLDLQFLGDVVRQRRAEGRPDPMSVEIVFLSKGPYVQPKLPVIGVKLVYTEGETESFYIPSDRLHEAGWHVDWELRLTDAEGEPAAGTSTQPTTIEWFMGCSVVGPGYLWGDEALDSCWLEDTPGREELLRDSMALPVAAYWKPAGPGIYQVRAAFSGGGFFDPASEIVSNPLGFEWRAPSEPEVTFTKGHKRKGPIGIGQMRKAPR